MIRLPLILTMLFLLSFLPGQDTTFFRMDIEAYLERVRDHHPIARQADLALSRGDASVMEARGAFDPEAFFDVDQKYFDDKRYYSLIDGGLKVPTWFGAYLKTGLEQNQGQFLNPENEMPSNGLWYAGISLPVGEGLFIDKRRAMLRKAQIYQSSTEVERTLLLNELFFESGKAYWDWFASFHVVKVYEEALFLAQQRFDAVKQGVRLGDRPAIDTLEAGIQVQNRELGFLQSQLDYQNAMASLSVYLWDEGLIPLEIAENTVPPALEETVAVDLDQGLLQRMDSLTLIHPDLQMARLKLQSMDLDRRMRVEALKPKLDLNYNAITEAIEGDVLENYSLNNYKWGLDFSIPIFLRQERGALRMTQVMIQEAELGLETKSAQVVFKAISAMNELSTTNDQANVYVQNVRDYLGLLTGERQMFDTGESSLFMVNARELGYVNAQINFIDILAKNRKSDLKVGYAFGSLIME
jgi:outer membrane protein TolC